MRCRLIAELAMQPVLFLTGSGGALLDGSIKPPFIRGNAN